MSLIWENIEHEETAAKGNLLSEEPLNFMHTCIAVRNSILMFLCSCGVKRLVAFPDKDSVELLGNMTDFLSLPQNHT